MGNKQTFTVDKMGDQTGRVFLITGANTGLGLESAKQLTKVGATVVIACRNPEKGKAALDQIREFAEGKGRVEFVKCDLGDLDSIRQCRKDFDDLGLNKLHVLLNNAGVMMCPFGTTKQGFETQFGVNHVGHFLLTSLFYPLIYESSSSENWGRIVNVSSAAHTWGPEEGIMFDNMLWEEEKGMAYSDMKAYGHSKYANIVFTQELAKKVHEAGHPIYCNAIHPGVVNTDLGRHMEEKYGSTTMWFLSKFLTNVKSGALTQLFASTICETQGKYFVPVAKEKAVGGPTITKEMQERLWAWSEESTGQKFVIASKN